MVSRSISLGGMAVPRIGLGTNRLTDTAENAAFLRGAVEAGIGLIDTAHLYQGGESQTTIGKALSPLPSGVVVATKGGFRPGEGRPDVLREQIDNSLHALRLERIPLYYLHRVDPETPLEVTLGVIRDYVDDGRIAVVGISDVTVQQIEQARQVLPIAAVQNQYNLDQRRHDPVVDYCELEGIVFVPFHPLKGDHPALDGIARARGVTRSQVALAWLLHRSPAMLPIPGTLSLDHVRENLAALDLELTPQELEALS